MCIRDRTNILKAIKEFKKNINEIEALIKDNEWELLSEKLKKAMEIRSNFTT